MWQYLEDFVATTNRPLVLLGDFNDMLSEDKKLGGLLINPTRIRAFRNCLDNCGLRATASVRAKFLSILQKKKHIFSMNHLLLPCFPFPSSFFSLFFLFLQQISQTQTNLTTAIMTLPPTTQVSPNCNDPPLPPPILIYCTVPT